jgi:hypothetical protein
MDEEATRTEIQESGGFFGRRRSRRSSRRRSRRRSVPSTTSTTTAAPLKACPVGELRVTERAQCTTPPAVCDVGLFRATEGAQCTTPPAAPPAAMTDQCKDDFNLMVRPRNVIVSLLHYIDLPATPHQVFTHSRTPPQWCRMPIHPSLCIH